MKSTQQDNPDSSEEPLFGPEEHGSTADSPIGKDEETRSNCLTELHSALERLSAVEKLLREFQNNLPTVRELHARLADANRVIEGISILPLFRDLFLMRDRFEKMGDIDTANVAETTIEELDEIMARQGVDLMPFAPGPFDPALQESLGRRKSESPAGTAVELVRDGFLFENRVVRAQQVIVAE